MKCEQLRSSFDRMETANIKDYIRGGGTRHQIVIGIIVRRRSEDAQTVRARRYIAFDQQGYEK